jgi:acetyltransferase-like isoleucine patch superfamily enzyme
MGLKKDIKARIKALGLRIKKRKECNISYTSYIGEDVIMEGHNSIGEKTIVDHTYLGFGTYIANYSDLTDMCVGKFCSIGSEVIHVIGSHPTRTFVSTHPAFFNPKHVCKLSFIEESKYDDLKKLDCGYGVKIGNDVWIGSRVSILDGVVISDGAVIAAGAVVTRNVASYTIVGGIPAKEIGKRFDDKTIENLERIKWWDWDIDTIKGKAYLFKDIGEFQFLFEDKVNA